MIVENLYKITKKYVKNEKILMIGMIKYDEESRGRGIIMYIAIVMN